MKSGFVIVWSLVAALSPVLSTPAAAASEGQSGNSAVLKVRESSLAKPLVWQGTLDRPATGRGQVPDFKLAELKQLKPTM